MTIILASLYSFFIWVLQTTCISTLLVVVIWVIRRITIGKVTARWHYYLWMILLLNLILPPIPESWMKFDFITPAYTSTILPDIARKELTYQYQEMNQFLLEEISTNYETVKEAPKFLSISEVYFIIWLLGFSLLGLIMIVAQLKVIRAINKLPKYQDKNVLSILQNCIVSMKIKKEIPIFISETYGSPSLIGVFKPKILLSSNHIEVLNSEQLQHVFYHELAHYKRNDLFINYVMAITLLLQWFNPFIWYAYKLMKQDQEVATDELALSYIEIDNQLDYGRTLIQLLSQPERRIMYTNIVNMASGKHSIKRRIWMIKNVQNPQKKWSFIGFTSLLVIVLITIVGSSVLNTFADNGLVEASTILNDEDTVNEENVSKEKIIEDEQSNPLPPEAPAVVKEGSTVLKVLSAHSASEEGLGIILEHAPFKLLLPDPKILPISSLKGAFMNLVQEGSDARHTDLYYSNNEGEPIHIWQSNVDKGVSEKPLYISNEEVIAINGHNWSFTKAEIGDFVFTTEMNGHIVQVSGQVSYDELVAVISSLK